MAETSNKTAEESVNHVEPDYIIIGKFGGHHGIKGWLKIHSYTRPEVQLSDYRTVYVLCRNESAEWRQLEIESYSRSGKSMIGKIERISRREDAEQFLGCSIAVKRKQLENLGDNEYYWFDIIGSEVENLEGIKFGTVVEMLETGANDVLVVRPGHESQSEERLIPWVDQVISHFDLETKLIKVDWDEDF